jgi:glutaredoxin
VITVYTTHCPRCKILEKTLTSRGVDYVAVEDVDVIMARGFQMVPMMEVDGKVLDYKEAMFWIKENTNG